MCFGAQLCAKAHKVNEQLEPVSSTAAPELESQAQEAEDANPRSEELGEAASLSGQEKARAKKKDWHLVQQEGPFAVDTFGVFMVLVRNSAAR